MTLAKSKLIEAATGGLALPLLFSLIHLIDGSRPLVPEFEAGAVTGVVLLKLIEAGRAYFDPPQS